MPKPLAEAFAGLPDPRLDRGKKHSLADVLSIALCAVGVGRGTIRVLRSDFEMYLAERTRDDARAFVDHFA